MGFLKKVLGSRTVAGTAKALTCPSKPHSAVPSQLLPPGLRIKCARPNDSRRGKRVASAPRVLCVTLQLVLTYWLGFQATAQANAPLQLTGRRRRSHERLAERAPRGHAEEGSVRPFPFLGRQNTQGRSPAN